MHVYQIITREGDRFFATQTEAHAAARAERLDITLWDVPLDKASVIAMLNNQPTWTLLKRFGITARGGMFEHVADTTIEAQASDGIPDPGRGPAPTKAEVAYAQWQVQQKARR
jgi:hypothetical protein